MSVRQCCDGQSGQSCRLATGQLGVHDLRAGASIVAVEGRLQLAFRDHSLAWLGEIVPRPPITLHEGERFVTPQHGIVSIEAAGAGRVRFVVQSPPDADHVIQRAFHQAVRRLARLVKARWRRIA